MQRKTLHLMPGTRVAAPRYRAPSMIDQALRRLRRGSCHLWTLFIAALSMTAMAQAMAQGDGSLTRIIIGFPPGGNADVMARLLAADASRTLGRNIIIESRPGASGAIAAESVARARPDGNTLLLVTLANAMLPALRKNLPYNALEDFEWVGTFARYPLVVVVNKDSGIRSLNDLIDKARQNPAKVSYSSPGVGTVPHLTTEMLANAFGVHFVHVPYKGEAPAMVDLIGGHVEFSVLTGPTVLPRVLGGELKPLAVTGAEPWKTLPSVSPVAQFGAPGFDVISWVGLAAPRGTPQAEVARLQEAFGRAANKLEIRKQMEESGVETYALTPSETRTLVAGDIAKWAQQVKAVGITPE